LRAIHFYGFVEFEYRQDPPGHSWDTQACFGSYFLSGRAKTLSEKPFPMSLKPLSQVNAASDRLKAEEDFMEKHPEVGLLGGTVQRIDSQSKFFATAEDY
jgi:hypothetical protein